MIDLVAQKDICFDNLVSHLNTSQDIREYTTTCGWFGGLADDWMGI